MNICFTLWNLNVESKSVSDDWFMYLAQYTAHVQEKKCLRHLLCKYRRLATPLNHKKPKALTTPEQWFVHSAIVCGLLPLVHLMCAI